MTNIDKAAEHLGAGALKMIKLILHKHDAAVIEASMEAIKAAVLEEREACAKIVEADGLARGDEGLVLIKAAGRIRARGENG